MDAILRKSKPVRSAEQQAKDKARLEEIRAKRKKHEEEDTADPDEGEGSIVFLPTCKAITKRAGWNREETSLYNAIRDLHWKLDDCDTALVKEKLSEFHVNVLRAVDAWLHNLITLLMEPNAGRRKLAGLAMRQFKEEHFLEAYKASLKVFLTSNKRRSKAMKKANADDLRDAEADVGRVVYWLRPVVRAIPPPGPDDCIIS